uniref:Anthocyanin acyltransferase n=1 Tax=Solanum lycopersicum TaxID=4081 RepID=A0A3Q7J6W1_SOLLC
MATVIEQCQVAPPPGGATEVILPLTYFDHVWLGFRQLDNVDVIRSFSIAGSPKHDLYAADFGWGRAAKLEFISIDNDDDGISMSLSKSKDFDGDLEIGLCLSKTRMNAFATIFTHGLSFLCQV